MGRGFTKLEIKTEGSQVKSPYFSLNLSLCDANGGNREFMGRFFNRKEHSGAERQPTFVEF
jgi:hypothetical protein